MKSECPAVVTMWRLYCETPRQRFMPHDAPERQLAPKKNYAALCRQMLTSLPSDH